MNKRKKYLAALTMAISMAAVSTASATTYYCPKASDLQEALKDRSIQNGIKAEGITFHLPLAGTTVKNGSNSTGENFSMFTFSQAEIDKNQVTCVYLTKSFGNVPPMKVRLVAEGQFKPTDNSWSGSDGNFAKQAASVEDAAFTGHDAQ